MVTNSQQNIDLQEAPLVALLSLCTHPKIPKILLRKKCLPILINFLSCTELVIRDLAVLLLKVFFLYDGPTVTLAIPPERKHLMELGDDLPMFYGGEYGGLVLEYLQVIVENRRNEKYLLEMVPTTLIEKLKITEEELDAYQSTFMEIDMNCQGKLGIDEVSLSVDAKKTKNINS